MNASRDGARARQDEPSALDGTRGRVSARALRLMAGALVGLAAPSGAPLVAQYPLVPSPVLDLAHITRAPDLSGYLVARETRQSDGASFSVNQARLTVQTRPATFVAVRVQANFSAIGETAGDTVPAFALTDAYAEIAPGDGTRLPAGVRPALIVGQFKTPFSLEYLTPLPLLLTADRSQVVGAISSRRDIGVMGQLALGSVTTFAAALVNGEGPNSLGNPDHRQLAVGRLTVSPFPRLAVAAKMEGEAGDRRWGYDARWIARKLVIEGERIQRRAPLGATSTQRAAGHYVLASYEVLGWLQPVLKWEQFRDRRVDTLGVTTEQRLTWTTFGLNVPAYQGSIRLQANWIVKRERPPTNGNELLVQLVAMF